MENVIVDTTVMPKNIAYPLDIKLYAKGCEKIVKLAKALNIQLRQTYSYVIKKGLRNNSRYAHCRKIKLAKKEERRVKHIWEDLVEILEEKLMQEILLNTVAKIIKEKGMIYRKNLRPNGESE